MLFPLILLVEGFISIAIEIVTIRQLLPLVGGSVIVTSLIIGVFLLFLALGYQRGRKIHHNFRKILQYNFFIAAVWFGIGLSYTFIIYFFYECQKIFGLYLFYSLITYLLLVIAPLIFILGQTLPMIMNMMRQNQTAGVIGGYVLSLSTIGSFLGAILTSLLLMAYLGVAKTIIIDCTLLFLLALLLTEKSAYVYNFFLIMISLIPIYYLNIKIENQLFIKTNTYANYQIIENYPKHQKIMFINQVPSSSIDQHLRGFKYIEMIKRILFHDLKLRHAHILVLGAGGFTLSAENNYHNHFTYIDIDRAIKQIVNQHFNKIKKAKFVTDDARHYLKFSNNRYHAIVVDVYSDPKAIPAHLLTFEYMMELKNSLINNGTILFNIIANPRLTDQYSKTVDNTIRQAFSSCMSIPLVYAEKKTNIIYVCRKMPDSKALTIYSDNLNHATIDAFSDKN